METSELIEAITGLTTRLIARLVALPRDTPSLARLTARLEANLVENLRQEGMRTGAIADLFGVAPRTLQARMAKHRVMFDTAEPQRDRSIRRRVLEVLAETDAAGERSVLASALETRCHPDPRRLGPVLAELVDEGIIARSGSGPRARFGIFEPQRIQTELADGDTETTEIAILVALAHKGASTADELTAACGLSRGAVEAALSSLERLERAERSIAGSVTRWSRMAGETFRFALPSPEAAALPTGWQAIVFDHLCAVITSLDQRLAQLQGDTEGPVSVGTGCSTYVFDLPMGPDHSAVVAEVQQLLNRVRAEASALRERLDTEQADGSPRQRVVFYVGQADLGASGGVRSAEPGAATRPA